MLKNFFLLRQLKKIKPIIEGCLFETVIHAFVTSRLDYCNALYFRASASSIARQQLVQNTAERILTGTRKFDISFHWFPVRFRIHFKIILFAFKSLNGLAPFYLTELLHPYVPSRSLRSADQLSVPPTRLKLRGKELLQRQLPNCGTTCRCTLGRPHRCHILKAFLKPTSFHRHSTPYSVTVMILWSFLYLYLYIFICFYLILFQFNLL